MSSWQARAFSRAIRAIVRRRSWGREHALAARARRVLGAPPAYGWLATVGLTRMACQSDGVRGEWLTPRSLRPGVVLYVHGGGFVSCSAATHRPIAAALARLTQRRVFSVDYRLAPEARLPAAHEDVVAAYESVIRSGVRSSEIALVGDSAGGNLVLSLAIQLRDHGAAAPACIVVFSPWTDLTGRSPSLHTNAERCAMFHPENMHDFAAAALGSGQPAKALVSPVYADLHDLPPVLLHVGSTELLLDDARRVHDRILQSNGESLLRVYDDVPHCWQMLFPFVPEAIASLRETATFIDAALSGAGHSRRIA
jgi:monoterpene epsilon-lactone hydrolase